MWKYNINGPKCILARVGMRITWHNDGTKCIINNIRYSAGIWDGCTYPHAPMIHTDEYEGVSHGPVYFNEFDCIHCPYVVRDKIRFLWK